MKSNSLILADDVIFLSTSGFYIKVFLNFWGHLKKKY